MSSSGRVINFEEENYKYLLEEAGDKVRKWAKDAKTLVDFFHNEFTEMNSTEFYGEDHPEWEEVIDEHGDVTADIIEYALRDNRVDANEQVDGQTVFEHYLQSCIDGSRYFKDLFRYRKGQILKMDPGLKIFLAYGANIESLSVVRVLVGSKEIKDDLDTMDLADLEDEDIVAVRGYLLAILWDKLDKTTLSEYDWDDGSYMVALNEKIRYWTEFAEEDTEE
jgi:hypothetical protein